MPLCPLSFVSLFLFFTVTSFIVIPDPTGSDTKILFPTFIFTGIRECPLILFLGLPPVCQGKSYGSLASHVRDHIQVPLCLVIVHCWSSGYLYSGIVEQQHERQAIRYGDMATCSMCVCVYVYACVRIRGYVRLCVCACVRACVCVWELQKADIIMRN